MEDHMIHPTKHPKAGQTVMIKRPGGQSIEYHLEDWWDRVSGSSWMGATGNFACMAYGIRSAEDGLPIDNEVVYGKIGGSGAIVHVSEIA